MAPLVSIITPTWQRARFLPALARCVQRQRVDWEWLVLDDSQEPDAWMQALAASDPRVRYWHSPARLTIGTKRNQLIAQARGELIAHFDDDDHYAACYLDDMVRLLRERQADLIKLSGFFMYSPEPTFLGYMDLNARVGKHYALERGTISEVEFHEKMQIGADFILFYGFSFVYQRSLCETMAFDDIDINDDESFIRRVVNANRPVIAADDPRRSCLHVVHPNSTSRCFSRYSMPPFLLPTLFPDYEGYPALPAG